MELINLTHRLIFWDVRAEIAVTNHNIDVKVRVLRTAGIQYEQPDAFCFELKPAITIDLNPKARFKRLCSPLSSLLSLSTMSPRISTHNYFQTSRYTMP